MLPIVKEGFNSLHANANEIVHNTFNLTGFSLDKLRKDKNLTGSDQEIDKMKLVMPREKRIVK